MTYFQSNWSCWSYLSHSASKKDATDTAVCRSASDDFDLHIGIDNEGRLRKKTLRQDDFNIPIMNFPFLCSNIQATPAYGVFVSQFQYSRTCASYQDSLDGGLQLTRKLLNQGFLVVKLKSSHQTCYGRHHDLVNRYGISVSQMIVDMFHLS